MKKLVKVLCLSLLLLGVVTPIHVHDDKCGYDPKTKTGCKYEGTVSPLDDKDPRF